MAWIESHQALKEHRKTFALAKALGIHRAQAIGILHCLWWWTLDTRDGNIGSDPRAVAAVCMWDGDAQKLVDALKESGFVDPGGAIHDWDTYTGRLITIRRKNALRAKTSRIRARSVRAAYTHPVRAACGATNPTNPTNPTEETASHNTSRTVKVNVKRKVDDDFRQRMVDEHPSIAPQRVTEAIDDAMAHKASRKWIDQQRYVRNWLRRQFADGDQPAISAQDGIPDCTKCGQLARGGFELTSAGAVCFACAEKALPPPRRRIARGSPQMP